MIFYVFHLILYKFSVGDMFLE